MWEAEFQKDEAGLDVGEGLQTRRPDVTLPSGEFYDIPKAIPGAGSAAMWLHSGLLDEAAIFGLFCLTDSHSVAELHGL